MKIRDLGRPAGMPGEIVQKLNGAFVGGLQQPDVRQRLEAQGLEISKNQKPEQLGAFIQSEVKKWREVVRISGARAD